MSPPSSSALVAEVSAVLAALGASYDSQAARDHHYATWIFAMVIDEGLTVGDAWLDGAIASNGDAIFRGKPSDIDWPPRFTYGVVEGPRRDWIVHVDLNVVGKSGASHGVDVSIIPASTMNRAWNLPANPNLTRNGIGIEAKCFTKALTPNEGRVALGFAAELEGQTWLAANLDNVTVRTVLRFPAHRADFFGDLVPGSTSETVFRDAVRAGLSR